VLRTADLDYELPEERIATSPAEPRDAARMMVVERAEGGEVQDRVVRELPGLLRRGDLLVFNTTRVVPARFVGKRAGSGGKIDGLFLSEVGGGAGQGGPLRWHAFVKGRHTRAGAAIEVFERDGSLRRAGVTMRVLGRSEEEPGAWVVEVGGVATTGEALERVGLTPLPPYIVAARRHLGVSAEEMSDRERYQTVYARQEGSVAAPTAGLHVTPGLLEAIAAAWIERADVVLHVGSGTFKPVETEFVEQHPMHAEWCSMSPETARAIAQTKARGGRVIAVGTTAARTIEAYGEWVGPEARPPPSITTRLLITPGYRWRWVDGLLTNFHLPRSTLMALVAARLEGDGVSRLKALYRRGLERGYRFYSYGDAMLIAPRA
jgi:S-adenosylmethionine:tRNA ribosyltransferase-isomerase